MSEEDQGFWFGKESSMKDRVEIDGITYIREGALEKAKDKEGRPFAIIRCRNAGVHAGFVVERNGTEVKLSTSRRLWRWHGRTLSGLALEGPDDVSLCKFGPTLPRIEVLDACEVIPCTEQARRVILEEVPEWENE
jgi:hypothetical protein